MFDAVPGRHTDSEGLLPMVDDVEMFRAGHHDGPVRVLLLADTHLPARARDLPGVVWDQVEAADLVVHAGDWVTPALLDELAARSRALLACWGNNDGPELRERLPEVARAVVAGVRIGVVHESGPRTGREARMRAAFPDLDLLVFGHSHIPWDTEADGLRLLNPGSPTDRRRQPHCTYLTATLRAGRVEGVVLHRLPPRR
jgi:putative phosphoesterase